MNSTKDYQADGCSNSLGGANNQLNAARRATPEAEQDKYRGQIRYHKPSNLYTWFWVLK